MVLLAPDALDELGARDAEDARRLHDLEGARRLARLHRLDPLVADALLGHLAERVEGGRDGIPRGGIELHLQRRHEARGAKDAQAVLGEALDRVSHGAEHAALEVLLAFERIDDVAIVRIDGDGVDGKIATREIGGDVVDERDLVRTPAVAVGPLAAERRDLVVPTVEDDGDRSVLDPGGNDLRKDALHLFRERVGRDVPVCDDLAEEEIAHTAPHNPAALALLLQASAEVPHVLRDGVENGVKRQRVEGASHGRVRQSLAFLQRRTETSGTF